MCIVFWTLDHPDYSLIICTNRDEFLDRPTESAHFHSFNKHEANPNVLSGIDNVGGGTWTNITEPPTTFGSSRGSLVSTFLLSEKNFGTTTAATATSSGLDEQVKELYPPQAKYAGFNMLLLAPTASSTGLRYDACFVTNAGAGGIISSRPLTRAENAWGGFSNGIDTQGGSDWPKVKHGMRDFVAALEESRSSKLTEAGLVDRLFGLLAWKSPAPITGRGELRNTVEVVPIQTHIGNWASLNPSLDPASSTHAPTPISLDEQEKQEAEDAADAPDDDGKDGKDEDKGEDENKDENTETEMGRAKTESSKLKTKAENISKDSIGTNQDPIPPPLKERYYGTRLSTVVLVRRDEARSVTFIERDVWRMATPPSLGTGDVHHHLRPKVERVPSRSNDGHGRGSGLGERRFDFELCV
ncbi:hypothetical protein D9757_007898 [Collybiopsis confluens]|uniref:DUF833-domain-containing protein n=1 Tax=Collybiopsis confluens TaxID=2823264 RepID=A0A8H5HDA2_9AGAR|nr:hypothetical protein D9757_007898 [Collybiopsis confluens]